MPYPESKRDYVRVMERYGAVRYSMKANITILMKISNIHEKQTVFMM
jgi:hypothetical protein